tara:strand:- start:291 stop:509 length:219 start_codon:yes stop_codon:yes gene_type:complete
MHNKECTDEFISTIDIIKFQLITSMALLCSIDALSVVHKEEFINILECSNNDYTDEGWTRMINSLIDTIKKK